MKSKIIVFTKHNTELKEEVGLSVNGSFILSVLDYCFFKNPLNVANDVDFLTQEEAEIEIANFDTQSFEKYKSVYPDAVIVKTNWQNGKISLFQKNFFNSGFSEVFEAKNSVVFSEGRINQASGRFVSRNGTEFQVIFQDKDNLTISDEAQVIFSYTLP